MKLADVLEQSLNQEKEVIDVKQSIGNIYKFNGSLSNTQELNILAMLMRNPLFCQDHLHLIQKHHFQQPQHQLLLTIIKECVKTTGNFVMSYHVIANHLLSLEKDMSVTDKLIFNALLNSVYGSDSEQLAFLTPEHKEYIYTVNVLNSIRKSSDVKELIYNTVVQLQDDKLSDDEITRLIKNLLDVQEIGKSNLETHQFNADNADVGFDIMIAQGKNTLSCNIKELQEITGGIERGNLVVPVAPSGVGKSAFLTDWSAKLTKQGKNVLYVSLELSEGKIYERIVSNWLKTPIKELKTLRKNEYLEKFNQFKHANALGELLIYRFNPNSFTVNDLRKLVDDLILNHEVKNNNETLQFDLVCIDYIGLMKSDVKGESYEQLKQISEDLRAFANDYNCVVATPAQTVRKQIQSDITLNDIAGSMGIANTADLVIAYDNVQSESETDYLKLFVLKNRLGECLEKQYIAIDRNTMTFGKEHL